MDKRGGGGGVLGGSSMVSCEVLHSGGGGGAKMTQGVGGGQMPLPPLKYGPDSLVSGQTGMSTLCCTVTIFCSLVGCK